MRSQDSCIQNSSPVCLFPCHFASSALSLLYILLVDYFSVLVQPCLDSIIFITTYTEGWPSAPHRRICSACSCTLRTRRSGGPPRSASSGCIYGQRNLLSVVTRPTRQSRCPSHSGQHSPTSRHLLSSLRLFRWSSR